MEDARWVFGDRETGAYLHKYAWTKIVRHAPVPGRHSPHDPALAQFWASQRRKQKPPQLAPTWQKAWLAGARDVRHVPGRGKGDRATREQLAGALAGQFRDVHALEIGMHPQILDTIRAEIARLDDAIGEQLARVPRTAPACTAGHAAAWARLTPRTLQFGNTSRPAAPARATRGCAAGSASPAMTAAKTGTWLGAMYRRP